MQVNRPKQRQQRQQQPLRFRGNQTYPTYDYFHRPEAVCHFECITRSEATGCKFGEYMQVHYRDNTWALVPLADEKLQKSRAFFEWVRDSLPICNRFKRHEPLEECPVGACRADGGARCDTCVYECCCQATVIYSLFFDHLPDFMRGDGDCPCCIQLPAAEQKEGQPVVEAKVHWFNPEMRDRYPNGSMVPLSVVGTVTDDDFDPECVGEMFRTWMYLNQDYARSIWPGHRPHCALRDGAVRV